RPTPSGRTAPSWCGTGAQAPSTHPEPYDPSDGASARTNLGITARIGAVPPRRLGISTAHRGAATSREAGHSVGPRPAPLGAMSARVHPLVRVIHRPCPHPCAHTHGMADLPVDTAHPSPPTRHSCAHSSFL